jgi:multisubunit Na+/H+ antiporter MnhE subunit
MILYFAQVILLAFIPAVAWMILTQQVNAEGFALGYLIGIMLGILVVRRTRRSINPTRLPSQTVAVIVYLLILGWDIIVSGIDVFLRVLGVRQVKPGIVRVAIGDPRPSIAAMSAHGITITPGQLVVDFDDQNHCLFVHCLDIDDCLDKLQSQQVRRLELLKRIVE